MAAITLRIHTPRAFAPLLLPSRYKGAHGGRGSGKSHFFAELAVERCITQPGARIVCVREVQKSLKESVKLLIEDKIRALGVESLFRVLHDRIECQHNGLIVFAGMQDHTAESIKSLEGFDAVYVEEAQTLTARSLEMLRPTIRKPGSELWFSWNPRHESDPVDALLRGPHLPADASVVRVNYTDNPWFPDELEAERAFDEQHRPDRYRHVWLGEYEPRAVGALWDRLVIHRNRRAEAPPMQRVLISVDPPITNQPGSDECGILVVGLGEDQRGYVLDDLSAQGSPQEWGERAVAAYDLHEADAIVAEANQGGDMVAHVIKTIRPSIRVIEVRATGSKRARATGSAHGKVTGGKHVRAEPISSLYALDRISHVGAYPKLEAQMCLMTAAGYEGDGSPDRCLVAGTVIETLRGAVPIEDVAPGDRVLTRAGYRQVVAAKRTGIAVPVIRVYLSSGRLLVGTANHPVFVEGVGFIELDTLARGDMLTACAKRSLFSRVANMFAILTRRIDRPAFISTITSAAKERVAAAADAVRHSWPRGQRIRDRARVSVVGLCDAGRADVYNLAVDGENEYFANGVLVHNCDAMVWGFTELFPRLTRRGQPQPGSRPTRGVLYNPHRAWSGRATQ